jgi:AraC-like DNA-binding protein
LPLPFTVLIVPQANKHISPDVRARIIALHREGKLPRQIGRETGLNRKQVARVLAAEGIRRRPYTSATTILPRILKLRDQGLTIGQISTKVGFSKGAVGRALRGREP